MVRRPARRIVVLIQKKNSSQVLYSEVSLADGVVLVYPLHLGLLTIDLVAHHGLMIIDLIADGSGLWVSSHFISYE
jgi:hypothetical protein